MPTSKRRFTVRSFRIRWADLLCTVATGALLAYFVVALCAAL